MVPIANEQQHQNAFCHWNKKKYKSGKQTEIANRENAKIEKKDVVLKNSLGPIWRTRF